MLIQNIIKIVKSIQFLFRFIIWINYRFTGKSHINRLISIFESNNHDNPGFYLAYTLIFIKDYINH